jgi:hypothetical protein
MMMVETMSPIPLVVGRTIPLVLVVADVVVPPMLRKTGDQQKSESDRDRVLLDCLVFILTWFFESEESTTK